MPLRVYSCLTNPLYFIRKYANARDFYRGEDPNAKFLAMVAQREVTSMSGRLRRLFKKGSKTHGESLTADEQKKGLEHDKRDRI